MNFDTCLEIFGYIGTALVIISMAMTTVVKLRIVNMAGSLVSLIYAAYYQTWPVALLNAALIVVNCVQLIIYYRNRGRFDRIKCDVNDKTVKHFWRVYEDDIKGYFPNADISEYHDCEAHMVYMGAEAVGLMIGRREGESMNILIDYSARRHRDYSVAKYLFSELEREGISRFITQTDIEAHRKYLEKMGFCEKEGYMVKN